MGKKEPHDDEGCHEVLAQLVAGDHHRLTVINYGIDDLLLLLVEPYFRPHQLSELQGIDRRLKRGASYYLSPLNNQQKNDCPA